MSMALSKIEEKYIANSVASHEAVWLQNLLAWLIDLELDPNLIHCDNKSCAKCSKNLIFYDKSENIEIKYHYIRDMV
jgi:hypothetical protein